MTAVTVSLGTVATWQAILVVLSIISTGLNIWKMTKGAKQNDETILKVKDELKTAIHTMQTDIRDVKAEVKQARQDVEDTTQRLEAHIDRTSVSEVQQLAPRPRRRKNVDE